MLIGKYGYRYLGVKSGEKATGISLYPNPFSNILNISGDDRIKELEIYTMDGKLVKRILAPGTTVEHGDLNKGSYLFRISGEKGQYREIMIKK